MPFVKELNKDFKIVDNHFELSPELVKDSWRFKKITGTRLCAVLGKNKFTSPLKEWCLMVGIYEEPMDPTLSKIGQLIEPKVRDYVSQKYGYKFKDYVPAQVKWNVFKGKTDPGYEMFGGIPDGEPMNDAGEVDYSTDQPMLEVKTSSIDKLVYKTEKGIMHMQKDANGVPLVKIPGAKKLSWFNAAGKIQISDEYMYQLGLYLYLRKIKKGMFAVCFLTPNDYAHPENFKINPDQVYETGFALNDLEKFRVQVVEPAKNWYNKHIKTGISPEITDEDRKWLKEVELLK